MKIETPYLLFLGSATDHLTVKIANSIVDWRPDLCVGETALPDCTITKGLPRLWPAEAREHGARTLVVCANNEGGHFEPEWIPVIVEALEANLAAGSDRILRTSAFAIGIDELAELKAASLEVMEEMAAADEMSTSRTPATAIAARALLTLCFPINPRRWPTR